MLDGSSAAVSAAVMPEPYASGAEEHQGVPLADLDQPRRGFPVEGYVVTKRWAQR